MLALRRLSTQTHLIYSEQFRERMLEKIFCILQTEGNSDNFKQTERCSYGFFLCYLKELVSDDML